MEELIREYQEALTGITRQRKKLRRQMDREQISLEQWSVRDQVLYSQQMDLQFCILEMVRSRDGKVRF